MNEFALQVEVDCFLGVFCFFVIEGGDGLKFLPR